MCNWQPLINLAAIVAMILTVLGTVFGAIKIALYLFKSGD